MTIHITVRLEYTKPKAKQFQVTRERTRHPAWPWLLPSFLQALDRAAATQTCSARKPEFSDELHRSRFKNPSR
eukprot:6210707-Pleurochrysis_carterae.AAC.4